MSYIEEIPVPYSYERSNIRTTSGPSVQGSPSEHALFDHFNIWIPGQEFFNWSQGSCSILIDSTTVTPLNGFVGGRYISRTNKAGTFHASTHLAAMVRRPREWQDGVITGRAHYTGEGDSGKTFSFRCTIIVQKGSSFTGGDEIDVDAPAPASDGEWTTYKFDAESSFKPEIRESGDTSQPDAVNVRVACILDSNDTYTGDIIFHGFELMFKPNQQLGVDQSIPSWLNQL